MRAIAAAFSASCCPRSLASSATWCSIAPSGSSSCRSIWRSSSPSSHPPWMQGSVAGRNSHCTAETKGEDHEETTGHVRVRPGACLGADDLFRCPRVRYVDRLSKYLPRRTPLARDRDGVRDRQGSGRLLPAPRFRQLDHRYRVPDPCLACEACPVLDSRQPDRDGLRRTVLHGLLLAAEHDHVHGGDGGPFRRFAEANRSGVRGGSLDTVRAGRGGSGDVVHRVLEILPLQDPVPVRESRDAGNRWRTIACPEG